MFRLVFPCPEIANFNRVLYTDIFRSDLLRRPYIVRASFVWKSAPDHAGCVMHLNDYGFRSPDWRFERVPGRERVLFVGDSFTEGFMASDDQTIPAVFAREARRGGSDVEAINLGLGAAGIPNYWELIRDATSLFKPDAIFVVLYANDLPTLPFDPAWLKDPIRPVRARCSFPRVCEVVRRLLRGETVPRRWSFVKHLFVPVVPDPLSPWSNRGLARHFRTFVDPTLADAMERAELNPFMVNDLTRAELKLREPVDVTEHLRAVRDYTRSRGVPVRVAYIPYPAQVSDYYVPFQLKFNYSKDIRSLRDHAYRAHAESVRRSCATLGIPFYDLTPLIEGEESQGHHLYWEYDEHMRGRGYLLVGRALYDWWRRRP